MTSPDQYSVSIAAPARTKKKDLRGQRFGKLLVVSEADPYRGRDTAWTCFCDCGKSKVIVGYSLLGGRTKSCGKHGSQHKLKDLTGQRFGRLVVLSRAGANKRNRALWLCACDCDRNRERTIVVSGAYLLNGHTTSCGCFRAEQFALLTTRHGQARRSGYSGAYKSWTGMLKRCTQPRFRFWKDYGGRGIKVCDEWLKFENFYASMGDRPEGLTLDRTDTNGNYEPGNCEWVDGYQQARNQRVRANSKTGLKGINIRGNRYKAGIGAFGKRIHLGTFPLTPEGLEAAKTARRLAEELHWRRD